MEYKDDMQSNLCVFDVAVKQVEMGPCTMHICWILYNWTKILGVFLQWEPENSGIGRRLLYSSFLL